MSDIEACPICGKNLGPTVVYAAMAYSASEAAEELVYCLNRMRKLAQTNERVTERLSRWIDNIQDMALPLGDPVEEILGEDTTPKEADHLIEHMMALTECYDTMTRLYAVVTGRLQARQEQQVTGAVAARIAPSNEVWAMLQRERQTIWERTCKRVHAHEKEIKM